MKSPDDMAKLVESLAEREIQLAVDEGVISTDLAKYPPFFSGVCLGIAIATKRLGEAEKVLQTLNPGKNN